MTAPQTEFRNQLVDVVDDIDQLVAEDEVTQGSPQTLWRTTPVGEDADTVVWIGAITLTYTHAAMAGPSGPTEDLQLRAEIHVDVGGDDFTTDQATDGSVDLANAVRDAVRAQIAANRQWVTGGRRQRCQVVEVDTRPATPLEKVGAACLSTVVVVLSVRR